MFGGTAEDLERTRDAHEALLDRFWPNLMREDCQRELGQIAAKVETLAREDDLSAATKARALRYLGDVYSDLAHNPSNALTRAVLAYMESEQVHADLDDPLERGKLAFNYANAVRRIDVNATSLLEEAKQQYLRARKLFAEHRPDRPELVSRVDEALSSLQVLIELAAVELRAQSAHEEARADETLIAHGLDLATVRARLGESFVRFNPAALLARLRSLLAKTPLASHAALAPLAPPAPLKPEVMVLDLLEQRLAADTRAGKVEPSRVELYESGIARAREILSWPADTEKELAARTHAFHEITRHFGVLDRSRPGLEPPRAGSRAERVLRFLDRVRRRMFEDLALPRAVSAAVPLWERFEAMVSLFYGEQVDDAAAFRVEREQLRPLLLDLARHYARRRPMLVRPLWGAAPANVDPSGMVFVGRAELEKRVELAARKLELAIARPPVGQDFAAARFRQIASAAMVVLDFGGGARSRASAGYAYGIARALGKKVVVLRGGHQTSFDVGVPAADEAQLAAALDEVLFSSSPEASDDLGAAIAFALERFDAPALREFARDPDPAKVGAAFEAAAGVHARGAAMVVYPDFGVRCASAGGAGSGGGAHLFHAMPLRAEWSPAVGQAIERACGAVGSIVYVRDTRELLPDTIADAWARVVSAKMVVAELSGLDINVAIELGFAHVAGVPTLLTTREDPERVSFPMIAREPIRTYGSEDELEVIALDTLFRQI